MRICAAQQCPADHFTQVGPIGNAWVAGYTYSSLDGHSNAGKTDIFLMKFRAPRLRLRGPVQPGNMSSWLRAKSLAEQWHLLRAVQYPNFQLDNVNDGIHQHQHRNVIDEAVNQHHQNKIHNSNQHSISDDSISQCKRGSSSTGATGIARVPRLSFKSTWMPRGPEHRQHFDWIATCMRLVAAVVLPLLTACLCASLGICCYRAKLRQLRGAEAEPQVPNPLRMLPMTAEWPRGKVQKLSVSETAFELSGRQFQFRPGQVRHFTWEDGTVQTVQSIHKNVVWWSTQHPHPAWQRFRQIRWVCTPKCQVENHHDMELTDWEGDGYRCKSCSRLRAAGKHWYCPQHQVHVCPVCAELPPEMPTLGLAATYLVDVFPPEARRVTSAENPTFYDICPKLAHGTAGMGYNRTCPRDGRPHCSIVDALEDAYSGKVTHFVSWCWAYSLNDVVSAIERWVQKSNEDARNVFLWMQPTYVSGYLNDLRAEKNAAAAPATGATQPGDVQADEAMKAASAAAGDKRVCITQEIPMNIILPCAAETFFKETMSAGRINVLTDAVDTLNVRHARAGSKKDEASRSQSGAGAVLCVLSLLCSLGQDLIKRIILTTTGYDAVNHAVKSNDLTTPLYSPGTSISATVPWLRVEVFSPNHPPKKGPSPAQLDHFQVEVHADQQESGGWKLGGKPLISWADWVQRHLISGTELYRFPRVIRSLDLDTALLEPWRCMALLLTLGQGSSHARAWY
ncbi:unnamed protein product, partial [Cladocopium goreaui]